MDLIRNLVGEIPSVPYGEGSIGTNCAMTSADLADRVLGENMVIAQDLYLFPNQLVDPSSGLDSRERNQWGATMSVILPLETLNFNYCEGNRENYAAITWKRRNYGVSISFFIKIINYARVAEDCSIDLAGYPFLPVVSTRGQRDLKEEPILFPDPSIRGSSGEERVVCVVVIRKLPFYGILIMVNCIKFIFEAVWKGTLACYICGHGRGCLSSGSSPLQNHLFSAPSIPCGSLVKCSMAGQGENVSMAVGKKHVSGVGSKGVMDAMEGGGSSPAIVQAGSSLRRPLVIDMEAARKAVSGLLVVGRLLSPFQANPRVILDDLRNTAWKNQGVVTVQEVASDDGRFILNFATDSDRRFVLKAQPWHFKRDGLIFAEFDGKGDPAEVDLGVMTIWVQVRDLPFEFKTESVGWSLEDQLGEVLEVSH